MSIPNDPNNEQNPATNPAPEAPQAPEAPAAPSAPSFEAPPAYSAPAAPTQPAPPVYSAPAPPAPPVYGAPAAPQYAPQYAAAPAQRTNVLAIISMIASIVGLFTYGVLSIAGVIMGHISLKQIKRTGESGRGMALAGLIVGYVGIGIYVVVIILFILGFAALAAAGTLSSY